MDNLLMIILKALVSINGRMAENMKDNERQIKWMVLLYFFNFLEQ